LDFPDLVDAARVVTSQKNAPMTSPILSFRHHLEKRRKRRDENERRRGNSGGSICDICLDGRKL